MCARAGRPRRSLVSGRRRSTVAFIRPYEIRPSWHGRPSSPNSWRRTSTSRASKVCDIGAGEGLFLKYLKDHYGVSAFGVEPSTPNCTRLRQLGIECFDGTIEQFVASPAASSYRADVVTIMWTLENCLSCIDMLKGAASLVDVGGKVLVATGSRILVPFKKPLFQYFSHTPADSHCFRFSANALRTALGNAGLRTVATNRYVDNDILCVLAEKVAPDEKVETIKDHPLEVLSFFERWHRESVHYVRDWARQ